jgi:adenylylsulfate kinase
MEQKGFTLWFTGLPSSGKSAVADRVAEILKEKGLKVERLDGDIVRKSLTRDLGFSKEDREGLKVERLDGDIVRKSLTRDLGFSKEDRNENIRRVTFVAKLLTRNGVAVLTSFISPYREIRAQSREEIGKFIEVYVKCPLEVCIERDVRGMYKKALKGEIKEFTGVSDPYEEPLNPEILLDTGKETLEESAEKVIQNLNDLGYLE